MGTIVTSFGSIFTLLGHFLEQQGILHHRRYPSAGVAVCIERQGILHHR